MSDSKKQPKQIVCRVQRPGFHVDGEELAVGAEIKLTQRQVEAYVGKVKPVADLEVEAKEGTLTPKDIAEARKAFDSLKADNASLQEELSKANEVNKELQEANKANAKQVEDLEKANADLVKKVADLEKAAKK